MNKQNKKEFIKLINSIDLKIDSLAELHHKKWYQFGAYDALDILKAKIKASKETVS